MNAEKEAEYIAEIVRLRFELNKSQIFIDRDMLTNNADLMKVANQCIEQVDKNTGHNAEFTFIKKGVIEQGSSSVRHVLSAKITHTESI